MSFYKLCAVSLCSIFVSSYALAQNRDLRFEKACDSGRNVTIAAVGDLLLHGGLQRQSYNSSQGFKSLWREAIPYFREADIAYTNLEGPTAENVQCNGSVRNSSNMALGTECRKSRSSVYTSYPRFNYHPRLIGDLQDSGIDVVSTANNHSLDRFGVGADATVSALEEAGMPFTGTREKNNQSRPWHTVTRVNGKKMAWLACTYSTNGIADHHNQVLLCYDGNKVAQIISRIKSSVDAVIVTPHWGYEYQPNANNRQKSHGRAWLEAGATAVIGAHPHVVQPWEKHTTSDGREGLIVYSLGNFVSGQPAFARRATAIVYVGLTFSRGNSWVNGVRYAPAIMARTQRGREILVSSQTSEHRSLLSHLAKAFGQERRIEPGEDVLTNAECY